MLTKKDYALIAKTIREVTGALQEKPQAKYGVIYLRNYLIDVLSQDNPRFNRVRFIAACLPETWASQNKRYAGIHD